MKTSHSLHYAFRARDPQRLGRFYADLFEAEVIAELERRGIPHRMEAHGPALSIPTIDDPEGNMIELFPRIDHMDFPRAALVPREQPPQVLAELRRKFAEKAKGHTVEQGYSLGFMDG